MASVELKVKITGVPSALHLLGSLPGRLVGPTVRPAIDTLLEEGISLMSAHVSDLVTSEKSRGVLAESIQGFIEPKLQDSGNEITGSIKITIGSALPYAGYAAREIGWSAINRNVLIQPMGRWRFIGTRPPIPAHPFLEYTLIDLMDSVMPKALSENWREAAVRLQAEVDRFRGVEGFGSFWNKLGGGANT
jgi:hypothetical protein